MRAEYEARVTEEPRAGKPHAGICAGGAGDCISTVTYGPGKGLVAEPKALVTIYS